MSEHHFFRSTESKSSTSKPSTLAVAMMRAVHQLIDKPIIFSDPLALPIMGLTESELVPSLVNHRDFLSTAIRVSIAIRSRFTSDQRQAAKSRNLSQYVILGAGLDTYAYQQASRDEQIFEVDLAEVQQVKFRRLSCCGITPAANIHFIACDFERDNLQQKLAAAGFDKTQPAFFSLLGVTPYLEKSATDTIFKFIAGCAKASELVFDYMSEPATLSTPERIGLEIACASLAEAGETVKSFYRPENLTTQLKKSGFSEQHDILPEYLNQLYLSDRCDGIQAGRVTRLFKAVV